MVSFYYITKNHEAKVLHDHQPFDMTVDGISGRRPSQTPPLAWNAPSGLLKSGLWLRWAMQQNRIS